MITDYYPCPFCGQVNRISFNEELTEAEKESRAIQSCDCHEARKNRHKEMQIEEAYNNINYLCSGDNGMRAIEDTATIQILKDIVKGISDNNIYSATIKVVGSGTFNISVGSKNQIKVKRTVGFSEQLEANEKQ